VLKMQVVFVVSLQECHQLTQFFSDLVLIFDAQRFEMLYVVLGFWTLFAEEAHKVVPVGYLPVMNRGLKNR
jgi:hypothetical protein